MSEIGIREYITPSNINYDNGVTFNGLVKYKNNNNVISNFSRKVLRNNNIIFVNSQQVNEIDILPTLRTYVKQGNNYFWTIFNELPVSVTVTLNIYHNNGSKTVKVYNTQYNQEFQLPYSDGRAFLLKLDFKVGETHLFKEIKFYKLSNSLYTKYIVNNSNTFNPTNYNAVFDLISETPVISKWGCLLLTNTYDVIKTEEVNNVLKGIAELVPTTKVRMGNLSGIYNETFGTNQPKGFGLYGESVYLTGNFYLNNGKSLIDINNDVTMAIGNINRIQNTLNNLNSSLLDSIYNLTISQAETNSNLVNSIEAARAALTASFNEAIANNSDALFKLGKDYSLWAVGNAGISIINPNVSYDENGNVNDSTVGDGDEYIFLQGESVQIATSISEEYNNQNYIKVIVSNTNPQNFFYNNSNLYNPFLSSDLQAQPQFSVGWVESTVLNNATKINVNATENTKLFRYVALNKHLNQNNGQLTIANTNLNIEDHDFYSFSVSRQLTGTSIYSDNTFTNTFDSNEYYVIKDVVISGMFVDGKFNANLIEVKNILAMDLSSEENGVKIYKKNPNFDITQEITNSNYPVLKTSNDSIAIDAPFAVISGTTGRITAQGVDLRGATIGDINGFHIKLTDNKGFDKVNDSLGGNSIDQTPAIYIRDDDKIIAKFSGATSNDMSTYFKGATQSYETSPITLFNNFSVTRYRKLLGIDGGVNVDNYNENSNYYDEFTNYGNNSSLNHLQNADVGVIKYVKNAAEDNAGNDRIYIQSTFPVIIEDQRQHQQAIYTLNAGQSIKIEGSINNVSLLDDVISYLPATKNTTNNKITYPNSNLTVPIKRHLANYIPGQLKITLNLVAEDNLIQDVNNIEILKSWNYTIWIVNEPKVSSDQNSNRIYIPNLIEKLQDGLTGDLSFNTTIKSETQKQYQFSIQATVEFDQSALIENLSYHYQANGAVNPGTDFGPDQSIDGNNDPYCLEPQRPSDDGYVWHPLMCPLSYTIKPKISIGSVNLTVSPVKQETVVQGNGFASGYSIFDYFSNAYRTYNNKLQFNRINLINGFGTKDSTEGLFNLIRFPDGSNYQDWTIPKPIPILFGDFSFQNRTSIMSETNNQVSFPYYVFNGYSLVSSNRNEVIMSDGTVSISNNSVVTNSVVVEDIFLKDYLFQQPWTNFFRPIDTGNLYGTVNYDSKNDLYICVYTYFEDILTNYSINNSNIKNGKLLVIFGESWNKIFNKFGTEIFVQITSKYVSESTGLITGSPSISTFTSILNSGYMRLSKCTRTNNGINFQDIDSKLSTDTPVTPYYYKLGFQIDSYDLDSVSRGCNFSIMVNYIPNFA